MLKQVSAAAYKRQDIQEIEQLALALRKLVEDTLAPFYERHMGLYLSGECFGGSSQEPNFGGHPHENI